MISYATSKHVKNISDHLLTFDCDTNFDDFAILCKDANNFSFLINKSLLIVHDRNSRPEH